jgi:anti-sigma factor RsiW
MNDTTSRNALSHDQVIELLPFHANGSLRGDELAAVQSHLGSCLICRRELALEQRTIHAFREGSLVEQSAQVAFQRLMQDVKRNVPKPPPTGLETWRDRFEALVPLVLAASVGFAVHHSRGPAPGDDYRALASRSTPVVPRAAGELRVVFTPETDPRTIPALLSSLKLELVTGPNSAGAYTVRLAAGAGELPDALAGLRAHHEIALAEPASPLAVERPQ